MTAQIATQFEGKKLVKSVIRCHPKSLRNRVERSEDCEWVSRVNRGNKVE